MSRHGGHMDEQEFLKFWQTHAWPDIKPVFWRLYHDAQGQPICYSMEDLPGTWIDVTPEEYQLADLHVRVINRRIHKLNGTTSRKLVHDNESGTPCHPEDITIVVSPDQTNQRWKIRYEN